MPSPKTGSGCQFWHWLTVTRLVLHKGTTLVWRHLWHNVEISHFEPPKETNFELDRLAQAGVVLGLLVYFGGTLREKMGNIGSSHFHGLNFTKPLQDFWYQFPYYRMAACARDSCSLRTRHIGLSCNIYYRYWSSYICIIYRLKFRSDWACFQFCCKLSQIPPTHWWSLGWSITQAYLDNLNNDSLTKDLPKTKSH